MQRVAIIGLRQDRQSVISLLHDLGVVQIEPLSKGVASVLKAETDNAASKDVSEELLRIRSLMAALPPVQVGEKRGFTSLAELIEVSRSITIDKDVAALKQRQERLTSRLDELRNRTTLVHNLEFIGADLSLLDLESAIAFLGILPPETSDSLAKSVSALPGVMIQTSGFDEGTGVVRVVVVVPKSELEKFGSIIQSAEIRLEQIPPMKGTPAEVLSSLQNERVQAESELNTVNAGLREISEKYYGTLSIVDEQLSIESRVLEVISNVGFTESSFVLEGWVPQKKLQSLKEALSHQSDSTILFEIEGQSKPPTLMENPKSIKVFESFTRVLSPPQYDTFDPTLIFAFVFPIFFGLMLGDVGYGIVILLIALWIKQRVENPNKKTLMPAGLRRFGRSLFQPIQWRKLALAMIPGSIVGIAFGVFFNAYFGFHLNQYFFAYLNNNFHAGLPSYLVTNGAFLDPLSTRGLKDLLLFSGYTGLFFVSLGLVMGMINKYWEHEMRHIVGKFGWLLIAWGISLLGLVVLHQKPVVGNLLAEGYIGMLVGGIILLVYGEGPSVLAELISIVSHILSFTRLTGILLASIGFALVINTQFEGLAGHLVGTGTSVGVGLGIAYAIAGIVILVGGQMFNIILALFEPGIQGARLLFVEYFSKFYESQGKLFTPFRGKRTYTLSQVELMQSGKEGAPMAEVTPQAKT